MNKEDLGKCSNCGGTIFYRDFTAYEWCDTETDDEGIILNQLESWHCRDCNFEYQE